MNINYIFYNKWNVYILYTICKVHLVLYRMDDIHGIIKEHIIYRYIIV